eukprot:54229-Chlamydomonas_euryale.AAC.11
MHTHTHTQGVHAKQSSKLEHALACCACAEACKAKKAGARHQQDRGGAGEEKEGRAAEAGWAGEERRRDEYRAAEESR